VRLDLAAALGLEAHIARPDHMAGLGCSGGRRLFRRPRPIGDKRGAGDGRRDHMAVSARTGLGLVELVLHDIAALAHGFVAARQEYALAAPCAWI
jgi:hypothetical protein